jgi:hypothetical protein
LNSNSVFLNGFLLYFQGTESNAQVTKAEVNRPKENLLSEEHRELLLPQILVSITF